MADELGEKLLAQLIEVFDDNIHMPRDIVAKYSGKNVGDYSAEQIKPFLGLR
jgi:hypothetical protein